MGRPTELSDGWKPLVEKAGGVLGLADTLGLKATSTLGRYDRGEIEPSGAVLLLLRQFCKRYKLRYPL